MNKHVILGLCAAAALYLCSAFIAWDFNPGNWDSFGRYMCVVLSVVISIVVWIVSYTHPENIKIGKGMGVGE